MHSPADKANWHIGTMGFGFKDWQGVFYPKGLMPKKFLGYYSRIFNSVEIDSTFYGTPEFFTVNDWKNHTQENFKISVKVPREITHLAGLIGVNYEMGRFIESIQTLEDKLGVVLIQFPPDFNSSKIDVLAEFIARLPDGIRYAVEIRHISWFKDMSPKNNRTPKIADLLKSYNICWASTVFHRLPQLIFPTSNFLYIRWIGRHGRYPKFKNVQDDRENELIKWKSYISKHIHSIDDIFGYFNNDYSGFSPATANLFKLMLGLPVIKFNQPLQKELF